MRTVITIAVCLLFSFATAQTKIEKTFPVKGNQNIALKFDYPHIKVSTWDKHEIQISGTANINNNENNSAFEIMESQTGNTYTVQGKIPEIKNLPHTITVKNGNQKLTFKSKEELDQYSKNTNTTFKTMSNGVDIDIQLEIKVPKGLKTQIDSVYGMVEIKNFNGEITVNAPYGGIDATILEKNVGKLSAETSYGQIYTNLDTKFTGKEIDDFHTSISSFPGTGSNCTLESKYGNIYLRK